MRICLVRQTAAQHTMTAIRYQTAFETRLDAIQLAADMRLNAAAGRDSWRLVSYFDANT